MYLCVKYGKQLFSFILYMSFGSYAKGDLYKNNDIEIRQAQI